MTAPAVGPGFDNVTEVPEPDAVPSRFLPLIQSETEGYHPALTD